VKSSKKKCRNYAHVRQDSNHNSVTMKRKRPSPPVSENEFDISGAIAGREDQIGVEDDIDFNRDVENTIPKFEGSDSESDGDETFIAAQQAASNRKASNLKGRTVKKGGGFQAMGLNAALLKAITRKGFSVPTPIQRKTIPLVLDRQDVVGMARTGSGKTAAFVIPMIERLKAHSAKIGARAIILSPSRELALQTVSVVKEMGRGTDLRAILLVGGDSLEDQFNAMISNPDIVIATPGRFHHLKVEMKLDLSSIEYVVFDEADRLFEMGFAVQLTEILHGLPSSRQTLLFSATLPKSLVEFARAGLQEPKLVRLDAESKVSLDLESAFFTVNSSAKEGALLQIIQDIIQIPPAADMAASDGLDKEEKSKKRKKSAAKMGNKETPSEHSTIIFAATKHRVEYLAALLRLVGYSVSYAYSSLDQTARKMQVQDFRDGTSTILVVTDVAARGIDIPILSNVINYDFPSQPKIFVHRVGRTARAGRKGWSYSLVQDADVPYLLDLQLFLSRRLVIGQEKDAAPANFAEDVVLGALPLDRLGTNCEWVSRQIEDDADLTALRMVAGKGEKLYTKTRNAASIESVKRAKGLLGQHSFTQLNPFFAKIGDANLLSDRDDLLARLRKHRPIETVFEIGKRGVTDQTVDLLRKARSRLETRRYQTLKDTEKSLNPSNPRSPEISEKEEQGSIEQSHGLEDSGDDMQNAEMESASEDELEITFSQGSGKKNQSSKPWQESEHFMSYTPRFSNFAEDKAYGVHSGSSSNVRGGTDFLVQAQNATLDLVNDELKGFGLPNRPQTRWDKNSKKYVNVTNDEDGSRGAKMVKGESGLKIAASLRSGRFEAWKKSNQIDRVPRVGEDEAVNKHGGRVQLQRFKHRVQKAPKEADKFRDDFYKQKKKVAKAKENRIGKFKDGSGKNEIRSIDDIRKDRKTKEKRRLRNGRPSKRPKS
jgi:ATP-dependent RNA helicase DDX54/DBP10